MLRNEVFFDTNVIVYLVQDMPAKSARSRELVIAGGTVSVQVLNEFANAARNKQKLSVATILQTVDVVRDACRVMPVTIEVHLRGLAILERYKFGLYDSMIVAAALQAGCTTLYSEDLHNGLTIEGLTIRNPYAG